MKLNLIAVGLMILISGAANAEEKEMPAGPVVQGGQEPPVPPGLEELAKKHNLALPKDIKKALDECRAEGGDHGCVREKLKAAGFNVPPAPAGDDELRACIKEARASSNKDEGIKACLAKHAPKPPSREELEKMKEKKESDQTANSGSAV